MREDGDGERLNQSTREDSGSQMRKNKWMRESQARERAIQLTYKTPRSLPMPRVLPSIYVNMTDSTEKRVFAILTDSGDFPVCAWLREMRRMR